MTASIVARHPNLKRYGDGTVSATLVGTGTNRLILVIASTRSGGEDIPMLSCSIGSEDAAITHNFEGRQSDHTSLTSLAVFTDAQHPGAGSATFDIDWSSAADSAVTIYEIQDAEVQAAPFYTVLSNIIETTIVDEQVLSQNVAGHAGKLAIMFFGAGDTSAFDVGITPSANLSNLQTTDNTNTHLYTAEGVVADADEDYSFTLDLTHGSPDQGSYGVLVFNEPVANQDPVLDTPISDISVPSNTSGTIADISGNFSDANSDTLTYSVTPALPSGMTLNTTTGVISGNGSITVTAAANYTFSADDGNGGTPASDVVSITVTAPAFSVDSVSGGDQPGESWVFALSNASGAGMTANIGGTALTVTAQTSGSITVTIPDLLTLDGGIHRFNENLTVEIVDGANSDTIATPITPATGFAQVQMPDPIAGVWASSTFEAAISPAVLAIGDYIHCTAPTDSDPENGIFPEDSSIVYHIMDMSDGTPAWGTSGTITIPASVDTTPAAFSFTDATGAEVSTVTESNAITVTGVDSGEDIAVSITGGEYAVSTDSGSTWGAWTSTGTNVQLNHQIKVRGTSSASFSTAVNVALTVGGVSDTFSITTKADDVAPVITLTGDATINLVEGDTYTEQGATWTDNVDGSGAATVGGDTVDTATPGTYTVTYNYTDAAGNAATQVTRTVNVTAAPDTTAPTLSSPAGSANGAYAASGTVSTDEGNGTLYFLASANASETAATIKASGSSQAVTTTGSQSVGFGGLAAEGTYYLHYVQDDAAANESNVVSSTSFTTLAAPESSLGYTSSITAGITSDITEGVTRG